MAKKLPTFENQAAQGDVGFVRLGTIPGIPTDVPKDATKAEAMGGMFIVTHSETGHHHTVVARPDVQLFQDKKDPQTAYLVNAKPVELVHHRSFDTHKPFIIPSGKWLVRRQVEGRPGGWQRVED